MGVTTRVFQVKTYATKVKSELGGKGLYFAFGFTGMLGEKVCVYCQETDSHMLLTKRQAKIDLEYYEDEPCHEVINDKIIKMFKESSGYEF